MLTHLSRLIFDYVPRDEITALEECILKAIEYGYEFKTIEELAIPSDKHNKTISFRYDIDSDPAFALIMASLHRKLNTKATFYFRLCTADPSIMNKVFDLGSEVGYHYEELASFAKQNRTNKNSLTTDNISAIRTQFIENLSSLRSRLNCPIKTAASHGDFVNRILGIPNTIILKNQTTRTHANIIAEAYDDDIMTQFDARICDSPSQNRWHPHPPELEFQNGTPSIQLLIHPRQWRSSLRCNAVETCRRIHEGIKWSLQKR